MNLWLHKTRCEFLIVVFCTLVPTGCALVPTSINQHHLERCIDHTVQFKHSKERLEHETHAVQQLVEKSLTYRAITIRTARKLKHKIKNNQPLSGNDIDILNRGTIAHLELREQLFDYAVQHACWPEFTADDLDRYAISRTDQLHGVMLSLAAALVLYDNYLLAIAIFEEDDKLRRILNTRDSGYKIARAILTKVTKSYYSSRSRVLVAKAIRFFENHKSLVTTDDLSYIKLLIETSPTFHMIQNTPFVRLLAGKIKSFESITSDKLVQLNSSNINFFSALFGNSIGVIEFRKGKLHKQDQIHKTILKKLKAGDILLEKTPFRLTDKLIPGHWGHVAIWLGTEPELKALGIWNHPLVVPYQPLIKNGQLVVEALRSGVEMSTLAKFMNVDDLAILRAPRLNTEQQKTVVLNALRQVGKQYDFNFDVESKNKIVCSELIYLAYTHREWLTEKMLGRHTISPDNIAQIVFTTDPLEIVMLFHDGKWKQHDAKNLMGLLIQRSF